LDKRPAVLFQWSRADHKRRRQPTLDVGFRVGVPHRLFQLKDVDPIDLANYGVRSTLEPLSNFRRRPSAAGMATGAGN
jgi:hypothetical protein